MPTDHQIAIIEQTAGFTPFDIHFSRFIAGLDREEMPAVQLAAAILSRVVRSGDSCLDLEAVAGDLFGSALDHVQTPGLQEWISALLSSIAVGRPGQQRPLILDSKNRLYLYRYWQYEKSLATAIAGRVARPVSDMDPAACRRALARYFPKTAAHAPDWQKVASVIALSNYFSVITGGPGTGKTFTIARLLALYCELNPRSELRIHLAAPTGKAAAQLKASVAAAKSRLGIDSEITAHIPDDVHTLHRLLRVIPGNTGYFYHADNPLPTDFLVVDEASMVDLALMSRLMAALPPDARLVLAGDKDQLASIEAGSVLGDICHRARPAGYSKSLSRWYEKFSGEPLPENLVSRAGTTAPMSDTIAVLRSNYRFGTESGLGALSRAVRSGEARNVLELLVDPGEAAVQWVDYQSRTDVDQLLTGALMAGFQGYLQAETARLAMQKMRRFQVLCALKRGPYGADGINRMTEAVLAGNALIDLDEAGDGRTYRGRPVIITRNDYDMQLFNGDIGLVWSEDGPGADALNTYFPEADGGIRKIWPYRLPAHETVYAMTVHKSQGSEFDHVMLVLPPQDNELLTRELIYTALTRARRQVTIWAPQEVLLRALSRRMRRSSGLRDALWGER